MAAAGSIASCLNIVVRRVDLYVLTGVGAHIYIYMYESETLWVGQKPISEYMAEIARFS